MHAIVATDLLNEEVSVDLRYKAKVAVLEHDVHDPHDFVGDRWFALQGVHVQRNVSRRLMIAQNQTTLSE